MSDANPFTGGLSVMPCPGVARGCACGNVIVRMHAADGSTTNGIVLPKQAAQLFIEQFAAALEGRVAPPPSGLHAIRCEGSA